jgi:hypothetical protein
MLINNQNVPYFSTNKLRHITNHPLKEKIRLQNKTLLTSTVSIQTIGTLLMDDPKLDLELVELK